MALLHVTTPTKVQASNGSKHSVSCCFFQILDQRDVRVSGYPKCRHTSLAVRTAVPPTLLYRVQGIANQKRKEAVCEGRGGTKAQYEISESRKAALVETNNKNRD